MRKLEIIRRIAVLIGIITFVIAYLMPIGGMTFEIPFISWYGMVFEGVLLTSILSFTVYVSISLYKSFKT